MNFKFEPAAGADDSIGLTRDDNEDVVCRGLGAHGVELSCPRFCAHVRGLGENGEDGEVAALVVRRSQGTNLESEAKRKGKERSRFRDEGVVMVGERDKVGRTWSSAGNSSLTCCGTSSSGKRRSRSLSWVKGMMVGVERGEVS